MVGVGALMVVYVAFGGMRATTWIQIVKAVLLLAGTAALTVLVLLRFHGDLGDLLRAAEHGSGHGSAYLRPGLRYGGSWTARLDFVSLGLALVLGTAGLPHILSRFYTVPTARAARRSVVWAIGLIGSFYLMTIVLGLGAAAVVGSGAVRASDAVGQHGRAAAGAGPGRRRGLDRRHGAVRGGRRGGVRAPSWRSSRDSPSPRRPRSRTISTRACAAAPRRRRPADRREVAVARIAAVGIGAVAIVLTLFAQELNIAFVVGVAFAVAASANVPALLFGLFWRRFTTRGAVWSIYGGLLPAVLLVVFSPVVSGSPDAIFPGVDFHWFPLENPGIVSVPLGFLAGWLGTVLSREPADAGRHAEMEVRSLTGAGAV